MVHVWHSGASLENLNYDSPLTFEATGRVRYVGSLDACHGQPFQVLLHEDNSSMPETNVDGLQNLSP